MIQSEIPPMIENLFQLFQKSKTTPFHAVHRVTSKGVSHLNPIETWELWNDLILKGLVRQIWSPAPPNSGPRNLKELQNCDDDVVNLRLECPLEDTTLS